MRDRVYNTNRHNAASYSGKGITICARWESFENFLADMGERPEGLTLERIDRDKNYEPGNCKWDTTYNQQRNRCNNKLTLEKVVTIASKRLAGCSERKLADEFGVVHSMIWSIMRQKSWPEALPEALRLCYHRTSDI